MRGRWLPDELVGQVCCQCGVMAEAGPGWLRHRHHDQPGEHMLCPDCRYAQERIERERRPLRGRVCT